VIDAHCTSDWAEKIASPWAEFEAAGRVKIKANPDHEVYALTDEQLGLWRKAAEKVEVRWAENVKKAGQDPAAVLMQLRESLKRYNALY
jgi:hypothetical protein